MKHPRRAAVPFVLAALAVFASAAHAQQQDQVLAQQAQSQQEDRMSQPWYLGALLGYTHDSNVFRRDALKVSDGYTSAGLIGGLHWKPGRQHLYVDGNVENNHWNSQKQLDNTSHYVVGGLDWQTVEHLSGTLRYASRENLSDFAVPGTPADRNMERGQDASAIVRYGFVTPIGIEAGYRRGTLDYSITTDRNTTSDVVWVAGHYGVGMPLTLGVGLRSTKSDTPGYKPLLPFELFPPPNVQYGPVEPDKGDRKDIDFTATWQPSGVSVLTGRISYTREDHTAPSRPDLHGFSGQVTWDWKVTGKTTFRGTLVRDTGTETSFLSLEQIGLKGISFDNNHVSYLALAEAGWQATAKILVTAGLRYTNGVANTIAGSGYDVSTTRLRLGAQWEPTRHVSLACLVARETGNVSASATVYNCNAQFVMP
jgi:hypothetical protein